MSVDSIFTSRFFNARWRFLTVSILDLILTALGLAQLMYVRFRGDVPVLVDNDPDTWTMDPNHIAHKITSRTKAGLSSFMALIKANVAAIISRREKARENFRGDSAETNRVSRITPQNLLDAGS